MPAQSEEKNDLTDEANGEASPASGDEPAASSAPADPVAEAKAEAARMKDQWMRTAADFDNFRKRARRELEDTRKAGKEDLLKEFLPVFDNLERAIQSAQRATDVKAVAEGLQMVLRQYLDTLSRGGITKVPGVGAQFDPTHHEAIQQVETDEHPAGTVVAEVQPGYMQGDRLIRAAMVVVAKPKSTAGEGSASE
ncbi:MAG: nucleotide exchange factor GrpE [Labilithrix sp.]|nr:nucleotide exchange factor GrpE [Labilithrix sp.]MCW5833832.1 nucleotide exchange factor GrpE [Labilithrix sp.]